jgi:hypothetical protein
MDKEITNSFVKTIKYNPADESESYIFLFKKNLDGTLSVIDKIIHDTDVVGTTGIYTYNINRWFDSLYIGVACVSGKRAKYNTGLLTNGFYLHGAWDTTSDIDISNDTDFRQGSLPFAIDYTSDKVNSTSPYTAIVAADGSGDYTTIAEAINNIHDSAENPATILIKDGVYEETIILENRNISFVGTNPENCIWINRTGIYKNCPLKINGDFYLENLTFKMTLENVGSWTPTYDNKDVLNTYPGYALHIDNPSSNNTVVHTGVIKNCKIYSEAFPAVGMGTRKNQTIKFENCDIKRNTIDDDYKKNQWQGALFCHSSQAANEVNQKLVLKDNVIRCNYSNALHINATYGTQEDYELTAINNTVYSDELENSAVNYEKGNSILSKMSHGNNNNLINYTVSN